MDGHYLVHIAFTNTARLVKPTHYFSYKGQAFKITRTTRKNYADNLLTIVDQESEVSAVARIAAEYFSALAWVNRGDIQFGQPTWVRSGRVSNLHSARACIFDFQRIPPGRGSVGHSISIIPLIETEEQRLALALYREAGASNNHYLSFLFLWHILEVGTRDSIGAANKARKHIRDTTYVDRLALNGKSIGKYFADDCRHAIAHITRPPGETTIDFDSVEDRARIALSVQAVKVFAQHHIESRLGLTKQLYLYQAKKGAIPEYLPAGAMPGRFVPPDPIKLRSLRNATPS